MAEKGKAYIVEEIAQAVKEGKDVDGAAIGQTAVERVIAEYFTSAKAEAAIEAAALKEIGSGEHAGDAAP
jgi:hypothetical protein